LSSIYGWNSTENWSDILSLGEQQRISIARLLYHKPQVAILGKFFKET